MIGYLFFIKINKHEIISEDMLKDILKVYWIINVQLQKLFSYKKNVQLQ